MPRKHVRSRGISIFFILFCSGRFRLSFPAVLPHQPFSFFPHLLHDFLRPQDLHPLAQGKDPPEEYAADHDGHIDGEMFRIRRDHHDFFPESVDDHPGQAVVHQQLHPKSFEWNDLAKSKFEVFRNTGTQYGLIAQDVKEVMPEWVDDNLIGSGYMGIRYDKLIPVLLQGEIETISRVETLEDKVRRLEKENGKLKKRIKDLERRAA